jgi:hypothetical protein
MKNKEKAMAKYYEDNDLSKMLQKKNVKKIATTRRVTMNISEEAYTQAQDLSKTIGTGYQHILKTAIFLGMQDIRRKGKLV